jgi:4-hydroxybenzoate polyprenyltransferase
MKDHSRSSRLLKWIAILQLVRWRVVLLTLVVQYLAAYFVFAAPVTAEQLFLNFRLHLIVLCTSLIISAGFIINSFYDLERDAINHPARLQLQGLLTKDFALRFYVLLNAASLMLAAITGWKVFLFMCGFAGGLWFYSHKLQKKPVIREISASLLSVISLVSVGLHYAHYSNLLLLYAFYFMMLLFMREGIKDLVAQKGNVIYGYTTMAVALGERKLLHLLMIVYSSSLIPVLILCWHHQLPIFRILLIATAVLNLLAILWEFFKNDRLRFVHAHALMRFVIVLALVTLFFLYQR